MKKTVAEIRQLDQDTIRINRQRFGFRIYYPKPESMRRIKEFMYYCPKTLNGTFLYRK